MCTYLVYLKYCSHTSSHCLGKQASQKRSPCTSGTSSQLWWWIRSKSLANDRALPWCIKPGSGVTVHPEPSPPVKAQDVWLHWGSRCPSTWERLRAGALRRAAPAWHPPSQGMLRWCFPPPSREFKGSLSLFGKFEKFCLYVHFIVTTWNGGEALPCAHLPAVVCKTNYSYKYIF